MSQKQILAFATGPVPSAGLGFIWLPLIAWYFSPEDNLKISLSGSYHSFGFRKNAEQYLGLLPTALTADLISKRCPNVCWSQPRSALLTRNARFGWWLKFIAKPLSVG